MKKTSSSRAIAAAATVCAVVLSVASPAPAVTHTATITGGTIVVTKTGQPTLTIPLAATGGCPSNTLELDITSDPTGTVAVTGVSGKVLYAFGGGPTSHIVVLSRSTFLPNVPGTYDHGTGSMSGLTVGVTARMYNILDEASCTESGRVCSTSSRIRMDSTDFSSHSASHAVTLRGRSTGLALADSCAAPFSMYVGGALDISGMTIHVT